uniref:Fibronectin type-III domain-containing protein n=1 Tax=Amphimedon queenslandica TaxID=400682 RepID=A0A1X7U767_AMPQE
LLSEVSHASVTQINSTVLSLQYTAPYTLSGVPILHYNILILPTNTSVNITDTQYNIHINDHCISYNISITPWNIVGAGNISTLSDIILYQAPNVTAPLLIEEYNNGTLQVYIEFQ